MIVDDRFPEPAAPGRVIGTQTAQQVIRQGVDAGRIISIDRGALRIAPPLKAGWGRAGVTYGPFKRQAGLAFAVLMLNGHNTSQTGHIGQRYIARLAQWLLGPHPKAVGFAIRRAVAWALHGNKRETLREFRWWWHLNRSAVTLDENLALGWYPQAVPPDPRAVGSGFVMHAAEAECGELWLRVGSALLPVVTGVQNLPLYFVAVLRERGAVYYGASVAGARGLSPYPNLRPLAVDPSGGEPEVFAGLHQGVLGQIGFRADTRVYGARVAQVPELSQWYTTAHAADVLTGAGPLAETEAERGGTWQVYSGNFQRAALGAQATANDSLAVLTGSEPAGLICAVFSAGVHPSEAGLVWRARDARNYWKATLGADRCEVVVVERGEAITIASGQYAPAQAARALQILDDGRTMVLSLDGQPLFDKPLVDSRLQDETGVGIWTAEPRDGQFISSFEAHPRAVRLPELLDLGEPWQRTGSRVVIQDDFSGPAGSLEGRITPLGSQRWRREIGIGEIDLTGQGTARVRATLELPNPRRTAYTIAWNNPDFVDLEVTITPPGMGRGQGQRGRGGFIIWQDARHYIVLNTWLDDHYTGASVSSFFHLTGFEDLYNAIWTNVGERIVWGRPYVMRLVCDGIHYMAFVDGEPVLYRALTDVFPRLPGPLKINRVGLAVNWEWGDDTGSTFSNFSAKDGD